MVPPNLKTETVIPFIQENVEPNATIYSDELTVYQRLQKVGFNHKTIRHLSLEFVKGNIHTNTIEGFWGQLKRSLTGTYHYVSPKYLQHYVDEFAYRYNLRHGEPSSFFTSMLSE